MQAASSTNGPLRVAQLAIEAGDLELTHRVYGTNPSHLLRT
jgi:hypothetical protein